MEQDGAGSEGGISSKVSVGNGPNILVVVFKYSPDSEELSWRRDLTAH